MKPARKHHYVPEFLLAAFTPNGTKDDYLCVLDQTQLKRWRVKPAEVAFQKDFYRVQGPGFEPDAVEKSFAVFESAAATVIKQILETEQLPIGEDFNVLITFVAFSAMRVPRVRKVFSDPVKHMLKKTLLMSLSTPERWRDAVERMKRDGVDLGKNTSYEKMKEFAESDRYTIEIDNAWHLKTLVDAVKNVYPLLRNRHWRLLITADVREGSFISSDDPVGLVWTSEDVPTFYGPGFGMPDTEVTLALSKRLAIAGSFEGTSGIVMAHRGSIAAINSRTAVGARNLYSAQEDFFWVDMGKNIREGKLFEALQKEKPKQSVDVEGDEDF